MEKRAKEKEMGDESVAQPGVLVAHETRKQRNGDLDRLCLLDRLFDQPGRVGVCRGKRGEKKLADLKGRKGTDVALMSEKITCRVSDGDGTTDVDPERPEADRADDAGITTRNYCLAAPGSGVLAVSGRLWS